MSMNLTKLAKKLVQDSRSRKKNTDSSAEFHQNQLESICVFYLLASFCPVSYFRYKNFFLGICLFNTTSKGPADNTVSTNRLSVIFLSRRT